MEILDGKYTLRPFQPGDEESVLDLWETAFKSKMSLDLFHWKYLENPYWESMMLCVTKASRVVTFYGGIPFRFQYRKGEADVVQLMDIMSHPDHRSDRIFAKTANRFMDVYLRSGKLVLMYGFPGEFHFSIGARIFNYEKISDVSYLKISIRDLLQLEQVSGSIALVQDIDSQASFIDDLWQRCKGDYPFSIVRDSRFVKWRYFDHPEKRYDMFHFYTHGDATTQGYGVFSIKGEKAFLVDILLPDSPGFFREFMASMGHYLSDSGVDTIETWLPAGHFLSSQALSCGFNLEPEPIGFIPTIALFDHSPGKEWVRSCLYYTMGDGDLF